MCLFQTTQYQQRPFTLKNTFKACRFFALTTLFYCVTSHAENSEAKLGLAAPLSAFEEAKSLVFSDPYSSLPQYEVSRKHFDINGENVLLKHAQRTLSSNANFIELDTKHKLLQANGICFAGIWKMSQNRPYSGLFQAGIEVPIIVRASVSLSGTKQRDKRAFGIAIKLFPYAHSSLTENIFLMHSLGGTKTKHVANLPMTNEPALGELPPFSQLLTAYRLESDLEKADKAFSGKKANARFRPVSHLAAVKAGDANSRLAGHTEESTPKLSISMPTASKEIEIKPELEIKSEADTQAEIRGPHWLRAALRSDTPLVDKDDFRDELSLQHYPNQTLSWVLSAANFNDAGIDKAHWQEIGEIILTESVVSLTCDTKLHFNHPAIK
ncbi:hypothetical protein [Alteromonas sp. PRIM-21]|uniref:hypothetical protein n=1 Tax=Alteromonas sp. PRIM-21 TaxID=1454978 RepID=UPI0022B97D0E|nr:hypothetical protein [Alteromonas sp. PRIM-21]